MTTATATYHRRKLNMNGRMYDPTGERRIGPSYAELMYLAEQEARNNAWNEIGRTVEDIGVKNANSINMSFCITWGEKNGCGDNHDNSGTGNGYDVPETTEGQTPEQEGDGGSKTVQNKDGKTPETAMNAENLFFTCYVNYMFGNNQDIYVDASSMSEKLSGLNIEEDFKSKGDGTYSINLFDCFSECPDLALALGNIELNYVGDNMYMIETDVYDFNLNFNKENGNFEWTTRNVLTFLGGIVHCTYNDRTLYGVSGTFKIHFEGNVYINPRP